MSAVSFVGVSSEDREMLLGRDFRNIDVLSFDIQAGGAMLTKLAMAGRVVVIGGDPEQGLIHLMEALAGPGQVGQA